jgi:dihydrofolate reductase
VHDFDAALAAAKSWIAAHNPQCRKIILFGGGEIYRMGLDYCQQIELTVIDISPDGGPDAALFPELDATAGPASRGEDCARRRHARLSL